MSWPAVSTASANSVSVWSEVRSRYRDATAYRTRDGSEIRELMHPGVHGNAQQSLAEAIVHPGEATVRHFHRQSEELYHVTHGSGWMFLGEARFVIEPGDTVCIAPGVEHCVEATGAEPLRILCCCSPAYGHDDTFLV